MDIQNLSPMMRRYLEIKEGHKDAILLFRLGDFYEMFFEDAVTASKVLDLTLTGRDCGLSERAPMCGVPHHAAENYIKRLVENNFKVAICEQLTDPKESKGMVERDVVRVITPGTLIEDNLLDEKKNNYLAAVLLDQGAYGVSWADLSTGEFFTTEGNGEKYLSELEDLLVAVEPSEIIANEGFSMESVDMYAVKTGRLVKPELANPDTFSYESAKDKLKKQLNVNSLEGFGLENKKLAVSAAGALFSYLMDTQKRSLGHINRIKFYEKHEYMMLDGNTRRNLEVTETLRDKKKKGSLLGVIDKTRTNMGARTLRKWLDQPLQSIDAINARLNAVENLVKDINLRTDIHEMLANVRDLERLAGKISYGSVSPRDCLAVLDTLNVLPEIKKALKPAKAPYLKALCEDIKLAKGVKELLFAAIDPNAPAQTKDGAYIKEGFSPQLDEYRAARASGKDWLAEIEAQEREATGIKNLKVGYNRVFGYYIEVSKSFSAQVPYRYNRKQTIANAERFITEELKEVEERIIGADDAALRLESTLFAEIVAELKMFVADFQLTAQALGALDTLNSFALTAYARKYVKPEMSPKIKEIRIEGGRHPVVETQTAVTSYAPNDTSLDKNTKTMVITGPNMAGKSTYMRQVALIVLLAHVGCFVPATSAKIALTDRIFTRVGASDDLTGGQSTFMVEMVEVATILNNATDKSLLVLDEIGRGTSTIDGLSIAWAVMEYISKNLNAKTLFATHYHELTELEGVLDGVKNYRILVKDFEGQLVFLHKIVRGGAEKSFGIEVADMAGVPKDVVERAKEIMVELEKSSHYRDTNQIMLKAASKMNSRQMSFFDDEEHEVVSILKDLDTNNITPVQALAILADLKERVKK